MVTNKSNSQSSRMSKMKKSADHVQSFDSDRFSKAAAVITSRPAGLMSAEEPAKATVIDAKTEVATKDEPTPIKATKQVNKPVKAHEKASDKSVEGIPEDSILNIAISHVLDNPFNARQIYDEDVVRERAASIAMHGQQEPAKVIANKNKPGYYFLIDGHYRKRGLLYAGKTEIKCQIKTVANDLELYRLSFLLNEQRSAQSVLDNAFAWKNLTDGKLVKTDEDISELVGMSKSTVSKTLALLTLPEAVLSKMKERPNLFGTSVAYEIVLIHKLTQSDKETLSLVEKIIDEGISRRELEAIREKLESKPTRKQRESSRQHKIIFAGKEQGTFKEWDSGRFQLDVTIEDTEQRRKILEVLRKQFNLNY